MPIQSSQRNRRRRIIFWALLTMLAGAIATAIILWKLTQTPPPWFTRRSIGVDQTQHADQALLDAVNWTNDAQRRGNMSAAAVAQLPPLEQLDISFSQDDLEAFYDQANDLFGWSEGDGDAPSADVALIGDRLILAMTPPDGGAVFSVQFQPRLENGKLLLPVVRVQEGILPVPRSLWNTFRDAMFAGMRQKLPALAAKSAINADGSANKELVQAATSKLLIDALSGRPTDPNLFFPFVQDFRQRFLPVRLTKLAIGDHVLSLTVRPMSREEESAMLAAVRQNSP